MLLYVHRKHMLIRDGERGRGWGEERVTELLVSPGAPTLKMPKRPWSTAKLFQAPVDGVVRFMRENGFTLSIPKTVFIPFHTNNLLNRNLHVRINDECIFASKKVKYLGVSFSRQRRTNLQVDNNARNASRALNLIRQSPQCAALG